MKCKNHEDIDAVARCTGCKEAFCENCVVEMNGKKYCADCKIMTVREKPEIEFELETPKIVCEQSKNAFLVAIFFSFIPFLGIFSGLKAISLASEAQKRIKEDPNLSGELMASIASIIGAVMFSFWLSVLLLMILGEML